MRLVVGFYSIVVHGGGHQIGLIWQPNKLSQSKKKTEIIHTYMQMPTNYNTFRKIIYDNGIYDFS